MEFTYAWLPAVKLLVTLVLLVGLFLLLKSKHYRTAGALAVIWTLFLYLAPIKIDGTESKAAHRAEVIQENAYHEAHALSETVKAVETKKLTFAERMAAEDARSKAANQVVTDDIRSK